MDACITEERACQTKHLLSSQSFITKYRNILGFQYYLLCTSLEEVTQQNLYDQYLSFTFFPVWTKNPKTSFIFISD